MIIQGVARWAKIVGEPQLDYNKTGKEWSFDLELDDKAIQTLKDNGCGPAYIRFKEGRAPFVKFVRKSVNRDGSPAKPFTIVDVKKNDWDGKTLIGNGSVLNVKIGLNDVEVGVNKGQKKPSAIAIQVWKLEPYEGGEQFDEGSDDAQDNW